MNYDMKYHPMDEVTRPKRVAKRTPASCPPKTNIKIDLESSDGSSDIDLDLLSGEDESELESDNKENELVRKPDPRATRHSARSEAQKAVNYSRKHHPQDHGLPGFQRRAKRIKLEHPNVVRKKLHPGDGLDYDTGGLQQGNNDPNEGDPGMQEVDDQQMATIDDLSIHSHRQPLERNEKGRPDPKPFASFKDGSELASMEDARVANSTDNESAHGDRVAETGFEQSDDIDFLDFFPTETYDNPEAQTSSLGAGMKEELVNVEEQTQLQRDNASLTIVKPYFSGYQSYVLNPVAVPFELAKATTVGHDLSQPQDFDQPATGSLFSEAETTGVIGISSQDSQLALGKGQENAPQASMASRSFACFKESGVNQSNASPSSSSNTLSAVHESSPGALTPSFNLDDAKEERDSSHSFAPVSAQLQQALARDADAHNPPSAYLPVIHVQHEDDHPLLSSLLSSLGQHESPAVKPTVEDSDLPSTCAQSFASAEDTNEAPP